MFEKLVTALGPRVGMASLAVKEHQPEIFLAAGIATGITAAVMAAKAHKKSEETFDDVAGEIEATRNYINDNNSGVSPSGDVPDDWNEVTPAEERQLLLPLYVETGRRAAVLYGPAVLMGIGSVALILASHKTLQTRNRALIATVGLLERGFNEYRKRVRDELGVETEERFYYGAEARKVNTVTVGEDGKKKKKKEIKNHIPEEYSPIMYQREFNETNRNWSNMDDMNEFFLRSTERHMNDKLTINGYLILNEVYHALGFAPSPAGAVTGWSKNVPGDEFVSLGLDNDINQREGDTRFVLDFNVNGLILNHIGAR